MTYLWNLTLFPNKMSQVSSSKTLTLHLPLMHLQKDLLDIVEKLAKRDYHLFRPRPDKILDISLLFPPAPSSDALSLPATSAPHFGATDLAMGPVRVTRNQLYAHFLSLAHSVFPTSGPPYHSIVSENLSVLTL